MGFFKRLYEGGKNVLGKVVEGAKVVKHMKDKAIGLVEKAKKIPILGSALDAGITAVMNTPVGSALRMGNKLLDAGIDAGEGALRMMKEHEARTGTPTAAQLKEVGLETFRRIKRTMLPTAEESNPRLDALKSE